MPEPLFIDHPQGRTMLKWHRARAQAGDMEFDPTRILRGMTAGASVEVDLVRHAGGGFAVLHDEVLDRGTTGTGRVDACDAATLRTLFRRDNAGHVTDVRVALLDDLCASLSQVAIPKTALLQLDLKETADTLAPADIDAFIRAVTPVAHVAILSGGDARAVTALAQAVPGLATGHDPCLFGAAEALEESRDDAGFVARALAEAKDASMIYLDRRIVAGAHRRGFDMIAAFHAAGKAMDVWTFSGPADLDEVRTVLSLRADQITTDDPAGLLAALNPA